LAFFAVNGMLKHESIWSILETLCTNL